MLGGAALLSIGLCILTITAWRELTGKRFALAGYSTLMLAFALSVAYWHLW